MSKFAFNVPSMLLAAGALTVILLHLGSSGSNAASSPAAQNAPHQEKAVRGSAPADAAAAPPPSAAAVAAAPAPPGTAVDEFCKEVITPHDMEIAKVRHVGAPPFFISPPPFHHYLNEWAGIPWRESRSVDIGYHSFQDYMPEGPKDTIYIDIGGHIGGMALAIAAKGYRTISFEPVVSNVRNIRQAVCFNGFQDRMTVVHAAVGSHDGTITMTVPNVFTDNTAVSAEAATANVGGQTHPETVALVAVDTWWANNMRDEDIDRIRFIKIDTQGQESNVMKGMEKILRKLRKNVWIVAEHDAGLIGASGLSTSGDIDFMAGLGFSMYRDNRGSGISRDDAAGGRLDLWYRKE